MIKLTKINKEEIIINADLIETIQSTPDTVITLTTNKKILVLEEVAEIINKVIKYKLEIMTKIRIEEG